ncbi:MAG: hypothetical protein V4632_21165 [Pseudomonadota bacterium]
MSSEIESQFSEWRSLYNEILSFLEGYGRNDPFGEGDFWLLDDNLGGGVHKIYIFNISMVTRELVEGLMKLLTDQYLGWQIMLILDMKCPAGEVPPEGIIVHANFFEEFWDKDQLKKLFGDKFFWS